MVSLELQAQKNNAQDTRFAASRISTTLGRSLLMWQLVPAESWFIYYKTLHDDIAIDDKKPLLQQ